MKSCLKSKVAFASYDRSRSIKPSKYNIVVVSTKRFWASVVALFLTSVFLGLYSLLQAEQPVLSLTIVYRNQGLSVVRKMLSCSSVNPRL